MKITLNYGKIGNIYIVYEIDDYHPTTSYLLLENSLFGAIKLTKHVDVDLYKYSDMVLDLTEKDLIQLVMKLVEM